MYQPAAPATSPALAVGIVLLILGAVVAVIEIITMVNDINKYNTGWYGYNYQSPLTTHEITIITVLVISLVGFFTGMIMAIAYRRRPVPMAR